MSIDVSVVIILTIYFHLAMLPVKTDMPQDLSRLCPGARRSFFCRIKCKAPQVAKDNIDLLTSGCHQRKKQTGSDKKYTVIQCTGYLKSWAPAKIGLEEQETHHDGESFNLSCLVGVGRIPTNVFPPNATSSPNKCPNLRTIQFISRHAMDGKFLFVDQRSVRFSTFISFIVLFYIVARFSFHLLQSNISFRLFATRIVRYKYV